MSHYAVLVIHKQNQEIEELLTPYSEHIEVAPYKYKTRQEVIKYMKEHVVPYNDYMKNYSDEELVDWYVDNYSSYSIGEDGDIYSTYNPDSKWDWWTIGGRFSGSLTLTDEALAQCEKEYIDNWGFKIEEEYRDEYRTVDSAPIKDIQWDTPLTEKEKNNLRRWWEINVEGSELRYGEEKDEFFIWKPEYYKERYKDADTYIKVQECVNFHAVITPDGVWHEASKMGWFACTDGDPKNELRWDLEFKDRFINGANPELIATVVDCHI